MNQTAGFTDLRPQGAGAHGTDFWPAFTDIMTVVVMIFLSALVIHVVRNVDTVNNLRISLEAERAAADIARGMPSGVVVTDARAHQAEEELSNLRLQWLRLQGQQAETSAQLAVRGRELETAQRELAELRGAHELARRTAQSVSAERERLATELEALRRRTEVLAEDKRASDRQLEERVRELEPLKGEIARLGAELRQSQALRETERREHDALRAELAKVQEKYGKLVKPERSALGRYVVEIRYLRKDGAPRIEIREPNESAFRTIGRETLDLVLGSLKQRAGNKLYTKITIPENSGLSYQEAWSFSNEILTRYDYYYQ
jgi:chromosome segregation ATPase